MMLYTTTLKDAAPSPPPPASQNDNSGNNMNRRSSGSSLQDNSSSYLRSILLAKHATHSSSSEKGLLSKSLGDGGGSFLAEQYQRCSSEISCISHSGYLLKRSNHPFRAISPAVASAQALSARSPIQSPVPQRFNSEATTITSIFEDGNGSSNIGAERPTGQQRTLMSMQCSSSFCEPQQQPPIEQQIAKPAASRITTAFPSTRIMHRPPNSASHLEADGKEAMTQTSSATELEEEKIDQTMDLAAAFFGLDIDNEHTADQQQHYDEAAEQCAEGEINNGLACYDTFDPIDHTAGTEGQPLLDDPLHEPKLASFQSAPISMVGASTPAVAAGNGGATGYIPSFTSTAPFPINPSTPGPVGGGGGGAASNLRKAPPRRQDSAPATFSTPAHSGAGVQSEHGSAMSRSGHSKNPPSDFIDPTDGHIWRAKYCVLEDGVLYFYRNASDGDSIEAQREREETPHFPHVSSDSHLSEYEQHFGGGVGGGGGGVDDLSKSPMTRPHFLGSHAREKHSSFSHNMNVIWEKRVALDCVGAVRSAEQEYGDCSIELLAIGYEEQNPNQSDDTDDNSASCASSSSASQAAPHVNRLVLRAGSTEEMNEWLFQFHRSLASFMRQIVNSVGSPGIIFPALAPSTQGPSPLPPGITHDSKVESTAIAHAFSHGNKHTGGRDSPLLHGTSLSHGHGRNGLHRRRVRAHQHHKGGTQPTSTASTPGGGASPVYLHNFIDLNRSAGDLQLPLYQDDETLFKPFEDELNGKTELKTNVEDKRTSDSTPLPYPKHPGESSTVEREESTYTTTTQATTVCSASPETALPTPSPPKAMPLTSGKYIPPHLRNKQKNGTGGNGISGGGLSTGKYVPPHLRNKGGTKGKVAPATSNLSKQLETLSSVSNEPSDESSIGIFDITDEDQLLKPCGNDTTYETETDQKPNLKTEPEKKKSHFKLGGCADPTIAVASILDPIYTNRKASKIGKVHSDPYGNFGGALQGESAYRTGDCSTCTKSQCEVRWEVGAVSQCGIRESNEDAYLIANDLHGAFVANGHSCSEVDSSPEKDSSLSGAPTGEACNTEQRTHVSRTDQGLFAIFDGHCGNQAARFAAEKFPSFLFEEITSLSEDDPSVSFTAEDHAERVLASAMARLDDEFCRLCTQNGRDWESGATALVTLISDGVIALANLGDCKGVMCSSISSTQEEEGDSGGGSSFSFSEEDGWQLLEHDDHEDYRDDKWDRATGEGDVAKDEISCYYKEVTDTHSPSRDDERQRILDAKGWITTETEIPIGQLQRMDFADKDVVEILRRCFSDRMNEHVSQSHSAGKKGHHAEPGRIIQISRICGELAVSRALGDRDFKAAYNRVEDTGADSVVRWEGPLFLPYPDKHDGFFKGDLVSPTPEVQVERIGRLGAFDEFLLLACDGLWDVMDADDAVRVTRGLLFEKKWSAKEAAARLAELAIHLGSSDNITVIVISFSCDK